MILPDVNLLVYAYNSDAPHHERARGWWEACLNDEQAVGLPWVAALGYLRLMTSRNVVLEPLRVDQAIEHIRSWIERPQVRVLQPGPRHLEILERLLIQSQASARLTTDAHLAALAIEYRAVLHSNDSDFGRFPELSWHNPLTS